MAEREPSIRQPWAVLSHDRRSRRPRRITAERGFRTLRELVGVVGVSDKHVSMQLDKRTTSEGSHDVTQPATDQRKQVVVADIAGDNEQQLRWRARHPVLVTEIGVLGHDDATLLVGERRDLRIWHPIPSRQ